MRETITYELFRAKEESYKDFALKLLPGVDPAIFLGVRIPYLRKMAIRISKDPNWQDFIEEDENLFFEEKMLQGMVIALVNEDVITKLELIDRFLPRIDNWSLCDSFCSSLKQAGKDENQDIIWDYMEDLFLSDSEYYVRFAVVMSLHYYINPKYVNAVLEKYDFVKHEGYYVKMAMAWGISIAYMKFPEITLEYLKNNNLEDFTYNKALQKIIESHRVNKEKKTEIKKMKRKALS